MLEHSRHWHLRNIDLLHELSELALRELAEQTEMREIQKREIISFPPKYKKYIHFLKHGHVKIYRLSDNGQQTIMDVIGPGEIFGDLLYDDDLYDDSVEIVEALDAGLICTMDQEKFLQFVNAYPSLNRRLLKWMTLRFRRIEAKLEDMVFKDARHRIYSFIKRSADDFGMRKNGKIVTPKYLSQEEIAYLTATSRQTVASTLNDLRRDGILDFDRSSMTIHRIEMLN